MKEVLVLREYWSGDFTELTPPSVSRGDIIAYTLRLAEEDRGIIIALRREEASETFIIKLPEINENQEYKVVISDEELVETETIVSGKQLSEGYEVKIKTAPGSLLIRYNPKCV